MHTSLFMLTNEITELLWFLLYLQTPRVRSHPPYYQLVQRTLCSWARGDYTRLEVRWFPTCRLVFA